MTIAVFYAVGAIIIAYALGSINFAIIISKLWINKDIRSFGSGNAGATNVVRSVGFVPGLMTFLLDAAKGAVAAQLGFLAFGYLDGFCGFIPINATNGAFLCGTLCQLGHIFPLFFDFKGGKGVATTAGILAILDWRILAVCAIAFAIPFVFTRIISLGSVITAVAMPIATIFFNSRALPGDFVIRLLLSLVMAAAVIIRHRENIQRIIKGEEKPIIGKKKK